MIHENAISASIRLARKEVVAELKKLTRSKSHNDMNAVLCIWKEMSAPGVLLKIINAPNREKAIAAACKKLRLPPTSNGINLGAALSRFRAYHGFYDYVTAIEASHEQSWGALMQSCPVGYFGKQSG